MKTKSSTINLDEQLQIAQQLHSQANFSAAESLYRKLLKTYPKHPGILSALGTIAFQQDQLTQAVILFNKSLKIEPQQAAAQSNKGIALVRLNRFAEAEESFKQALTINPTDTHAYNNLGNVLQDNGKLKEALSCFEQLIKLDPQNTHAYNHRGNVLMDLKRYPEAIDSFQHAIQHQPNFAQAYYNKGNAHTEIKQFAAALACFTQAITIQPNYAKAHWNISLLQLLTGDYVNGWQAYEWRWQVLTKPKEFKQTLWLGESSLQNKTLLIYPEQGLGDYIQFCRYFAVLQQLGAKLIIEARPAIIPLLKEQPEQFTVLAEDTASKTGVEFDLHCPIMSLALALKTQLDSIPANFPYLQANPLKKQAWLAHLGEKTRLRVGLVWSGSTTHQTDASRSIALNRLTPLFSLDIEFHSLQIEYRTTDLAYLNQCPAIQQHQHKLTDFSETAALLDAMDLVISVDTAVAHLAAAMAKPVWILLPYLPDFRWLLDRTDSPWYPSATLFRQTAMDDWETVIKTVQQKLNEMLG